MCCFATISLGVALVTCVLEATTVTALKNITIGYLTTSKADTFVRDMQGRLISGAITYAIEKINDNNTVPGYRFRFIWNDTHADTLVSTLSLAQQWREGAVAFFGPEDSCTVEARVAAAFNLPIISYKCSDSEVSDKALYPTFARTFPPATQVTKSIISLLLHFNWSRYTLVVGSSHQHQTIAQKLLELSDQHNITLNDRREYKEPHIPVITGNPFPGIVDETFVETRVYVFLGELNGVVDLMTNLYDRGLLDTGDYIVIYVDHNTFDDTDPLKYFKRTVDIFNDTRNVEASRSLLVITYSPPSDPNYEEFQNSVRNYNKRKPFEFPDPFGSKKITVFAAYLYDAVQLYAKALRQVLINNGTVDNGTAIINAIRDTSFKSVQGYMSHIDANGDAEGNYTLLARNFHKSRHSDYSMRPVGHFQIEGSSAIPSFRLFEGKQIDWILGHAPQDEPDCGYKAERCIPPKHYTLEIVCGVLGGLLFLIIIILLVVYRNWRYEQEIAGLLWKIEINELKTGHNFHQSVDKAKHGSRMTLCSQQSFDSRLSFNQLFAQTGTYKRQVVALKMYELKNFDINRKMKKEMKLMRDLRHDKVNAFIGACIDPPCFTIVTEYCSKGSLQDILENEDLKLDDMFLSSLIKDLLQGMIFLHESELVYHGNLKSSNCVVSSWWTLQVADFGLLEVRAATYKKEDQHAFYRNLLWTAPELLRNSHPGGSQKGDVYAFAIILHEIFGRVGPYGFSHYSPKEIVELVKTSTGTIPFRPDTNPLTCESYAVRCMKECWSELPEDRPDFKAIWNKLKLMRAGMKRNIFDNMLAMMEKYQENLEELVEERTEQLIEEKKKTEALLHRMLPRSVSEQLKRGEPVVPETFSSVTIYFSDICGFTKLSAESTPMQIVDLLNDLYTSFDSIIEHYDVYKVETIGDAYMVVSGLPVRNGDNHAGEIASMALELLTAIKRFEIRHRKDETLKLRIGVHSGPCVAGVVGVTMPRYTLFGDTVNTASRMETNGEALMIHVSADCKAILEGLGGYKLQERGLVNMKGKGDMLTYWLLGENREVRRTRLASSRRANSHRIPNSGSDSLRRRVLSGPRAKIDNQKSPELSPNDVNSTDGYLWDFLKTTDNTHMCLEGESPSHHSFRSRLNTFRDSVKKKYASSSKEKLNSDSKSTSRDHLSLPVPDMNSPNSRCSVGNDDNVSQYDNAPPETECLLCNTTTANPSDLLSLGSKRRSTTGEFELFVVEKKV